MIAAGASACTRVLDDAMNISVMLICHDRGLYQTCDSSEEATHCQSGGEGKE